MKKLIINADDFGYSSGVNAGIIKAYQKGVLTSTTLMGNMPGTKEAVNLAQENPGLGVGIHLVLTTGKPLTTNDNLIDSNGQFYHLDHYEGARKNMTDTDIFNEWCAQIDFLLSLGLKPTHFDSHHHVHFFKENHDITFAISNKYHLPFRNSYGTEDLSKMDFQPVNELLLDMMNTPKIRDLSLPYEDIKYECLEELQQTLDKATDIATLELMVHPAFVDEHLLHNSSFNIQRVREVEILTDPLVKKLIEHNQYKLVNFKTVNKAIN